MLLKITNLNFQKYRKAHLHHCFARILHIHLTLVSSTAAGPEIVVYLSLAFSKLISKEIWSKQHAEKTQLEVASAQLPVSSRKGRNVVQCFTFPIFCFCKYQQPILIY